MITRRHFTAGAGALAASTATGAQAQGVFPSKPVTLIVPWPAGGSTDRHLRVLAEVASKHLGQQIVIDNKPGASGTLGAAALVTAKPDGYTLAQLPITVFRLPYMQKVTFDPKKDFTRDSPDDRPRQRPGTQGIHGTQCWATISQLGSQLSV